jgi:hypothetical protein
MDMREVYQEKANAQLNEWQEWIETYKSDPALSGIGETAGRQQMMERLENCQRAAQVSLEELRISRDERWELAKQAVERAMIDLKKLLDESGAGQAGRFLHLRTGREHIYEPYSKRG